MVFALPLLTAAFLQAPQQQAYFQQTANYRIEARLDEPTNVLHARTRLRYTSRAPRALDSMYFHLDLNAFRPNSAWAWRPTARVPGSCPGPSADVVPSGKPGSPSGACHPRYAEAHMAGRPQESRAGGPAATHPGLSPGKRARRCPAVRTRASRDSRISTTTPDTTAGSNDPGKAARRLSAVRQLARYLATLDPKTEVPPLGLLDGVPHHRQAHIYSDAELSALLHQASLLHPRNSLRPRTYVAFFSLLASTGLRLSEACALERGDVDLDAGILTVRAGKFRNYAEQAIMPTLASATPTGT